VVQNVEVRFLKGTASVREASSIGALWKVWESFKNRKGNTKSNLSSETSFYLLI
jgi:hypothetical protein